MSTPPLEALIQEQTGTCHVDQRLRTRVRSRVERDGAYAVAQDLGTTPLNVQAITSGQRAPIDLVESLPALLAELDAADRQGR